MDPTTRHRTFSIPRFVLVTALGVIALAGLSMDGRAALASAPADAPPAAGPAKGQRAGGWFMVQGVDPTDVLNVRATAGPHGRVVGAIPPGSGGVLATGRMRQVGTSIWLEIAYLRMHGWVNGRFLAASRAADDDGPSARPAREIPPPASAANKGAPALAPPKDPAPGRTTDSTAPDPFAPKGESSPPAPAATARPEEPPPPRR
jgi:uncharacterized protein YraI